MNLKEAFRYQNFLEDMLSCVENLLQDSSYLYTTTRTHLCHKANPNAEDVVEIIEPDETYLVADIIEFGLYIIDAKKSLMHAVSEAKAKLNIDIDAEVGANKMRREFCESLKPMLRRKNKKRIERGEGYAFNNEGNQSTYYYDIEVEATAWGMRFIFSSEL